MWPKNHLKHELFVGDLGVDDGQGVDPDPPASVLELDGVVQQHPEQSINLVNTNNHWTFFIDGFHFKLTLTLKTTIIWRFPLQPKNIRA
jgi:hypothetical protein